MPETRRSPGVGRRTLVRIISWFPSISMSQAISRWTRRYSFPGAISTPLLPRDEPVISRDDPQMLKYSVQISWLLHDVCESPSSQPHVTRNVGKWDKRGTRRVPSVPFVYILSKARLDCAVFREHPIARHADAFAPAGDSHRTHPPHLLVKRWQSGTLDIEISASHAFLRVCFRATSVLPGDLPYSRLNFGTHLSSYSCIFVTSAFHIIAVLQYLRHLCISVFLPPHICISPRPPVMNDA